MISLQAAQGSAFLSSGFRILAFLDCLGFSGSGGGSIIMMFAAFRAAAITSIGSEVSEPEAEAAEPEADTAEPDADAAGLEADAAEPDANAAGLEAEAAEPEAEAAEPDADAAEPEAEAAEPESVISKSFKLIVSWKEM